MKIPDEKINCPLNSAFCILFKNDTSVRYARFHHDTQRRSALAHHKISQKIKLDNTRAQFKHFQN